MVNINKEKFMSSYSVKKPITVLMGVLIIIVLGIFSVTKLPLTLFPDINLPFVVTITTYEGASPEELEVEVSRKIESSVSTINNFKEITSMSNEHFAVSIISFSDATNMDSVVIELRELLNNTNFPDDVKNTQIMRITPDMMPVMTVNMFRTYDEELTDEEILIKNTEWVNRDVMNDLLSIPGVADVSLSGAADVILQVNLDLDKLNEYNLDHQGVLDIIDGQNVGGLVGIVLDSGEIRMLYLGDKLNLMPEIETLPITFDGTDVIYLNDLVIEDGINFVNANTNTYSKINGKQGIQISFFNQSDTGITEVTNNIINRLDEIVLDNGSDAEYVVLMNQGEYITRSINSVILNIIIGGLIAVVILFLFLKDFKPTIIVGLAIPISVIATFMLMYFTNITLNVVSMGGLALGIGMLVDNAVVVIENIFRMISEGKPKKEAAVEGAKQVAGAITASTLTTAAVFLPLLLVEGLVSDIFISMALTITYSLGASLIIALTLVPSMSSRFLNDKKLKKEGQIISKLKQWYQSSILYTIKHKFITITLIIVLLASSIYLVISKGFIFLPETDEGSIDITIELSNKVDFESKVLYADLITKELMEISDIETVSGRIGNGVGLEAMGMFRGNANSINFTVNLKDSRNKETSEYSLIIEKLINDFDLDAVTGLDEDQIYEISIDSQNSTGNFMGAQGVQIKVSGYDLETLEIIANDISTILEETDGIEKVENGINKGADNVKITVNREQAMRYGLTGQDVMTNINYLYQNLGALGETKSVNVTIEGIDYQLDVPQNSFSGGIEFSIFGDYIRFLGGVKLFDSPTRAMIDEYTNTTGESIYLMNAFLPTYQQGDLIQLVVNPYLKVIDGKIVLDPVSPEATLLSKSVAPLYQEGEDSVTTIDKITGFATINTDGSNRFIQVSGEIEEDKNVTKVSQQAISKVNEYLESSEFTQFGSGYLVEFQGENEEIMKAFIDLILAALVAVLLVYMIMAIQFQSLKYPLIILGTLPLAFTGGMIALIITDSNLSLVSLMGFIILIGIVVNNGIVLIDYIIKLRESGMKVIDAIVEAGKTRLRPIFMTALTTVFALITMAFGYGEGAELLQPMAITAIGGLIYATILTLFFVPIIYAMFNYRTIMKEKFSDAIDEK